MASIIRQALATGRTPLHAAAKRYDATPGGEATVDALVRAGPPGYLMAARDSAGRVPLHAAAKSGATAGVRRFASRGGRHAAGSNI